MILVMAMTCMAISVDWAIHAFIALEAGSRIFTTWQVGEVSTL